MDYCVLTFALLLSAYGLYLIQSLPRALLGSDLHAWRNVCSKTLIQHMLAWFLKKGEVSEKEIYIRQLILDKKLEWSQRLYTVALPMLSVLMIVIICNRQPVGQQLVTLAKAFAIASPYCVMLTIKLFPKLFSTSTVDYWHSLMMIPLAFAACPWSIDNKIYHMTLVRMSGLLSLLASCANFKQCQYTFWNFLLMALRIYTFISTVYEPDHPCETLHMHPALYIQEQVCVFFFTLVILNCFNYLIETDVRRHHEIQTQRTQTSALLSLLRILCDVVVELDDVHKLVQDVPALATLLLSSGCKATRGVMLEDFMPDEEDKKAFREHLIANSDSCTASVLHSCLKDTSDNRIRTEFFHVPFRSCVNSVHHLIGIREHTDFNPRWSTMDGIPVISEVEVDTAQDQNGGNAQDRSGTAQQKRQSEAAQETTTAAQVTRGTHVRASTTKTPSIDLSAGDAYSYSRRLRARRRRECSVGSSASASSPSVDLDRLPSMQVDFLLVEGVPIQGLSSQFALAYGSAPVGTSLVEWIPHSDQFFRDLLGHKVDIFKGGRSPLVLSHSVHIQPRRVRESSRRRYAATGDRHVEVLLPDPRGKRDLEGNAVGPGNYRVSLRILPEFTPASSAEPPLVSGGGVSPELNSSAMVLDQGVRTELNNSSQALRMRNVKEDGHDQ